MPPASNEPCWSHTKSPDTNAGVSLFASAGSGAEVAVAKELVRTETVLERTALSASSSAM
eukprot:CAMPEP_0171967000 /NCGR_PEP_ID=MMETSP0993-20121228/195414_1 /TAXON_ID=483369 /ORGANISM="non described non described, Strain CCMP2098" /LENGTH=59 /DNA_ID=CAMNT_0012616413 /DNA_START=44 /DNA_END=220 /DNA_ORIENTATION=+